MRKDSKKKPDPKASTNDPLRQYVKPGLSLDEVTRLKECFDIFDYEHRGLVSME
jgi:hypothetical protein